MKVSLVLMFVALIQIYAIDTYSQDKKFTVQETSIELRQLFKAIEKQSEFLFFFVDSDVDGIEVTVNVRNVSIETILKQALSKTKLKYEISNRNIAIFHESERPANPEKTKAQPSLRITGTVSDEDGEPMPGVNVVLKGTTTGAVTDLDGRYSINVPNTDAELTFMFVGYGEQTIPVGDRIIINVTLKEQAIAIEEVEIVAIGYGEIRRRDVTGAIEVANMEEILKMPVGSVLDGLAGRISGVRIISADGTPGQGSSVVIRGGNSITGDNNPLYVVDGFPMESGYDIGMLDPSEIESLVVLKDASSTAIYGSRGANGVIMITTKKGTLTANKKPQIFYRGVYGTETVSKFMDVMSPYEFVSMEYERNGAYSYLSDGRTLESYKDVKGTDWQSLLFRRGWEQTHTLTVRGGNESTKYNFTGGYRDQDGVIITSNYKRYNAKMDFDQHLAKWLKGGISVNFIRDVYSGVQPRVSNGGYSMALFPMYNCWIYRPVVSIGSEVVLEDELFDPDELGDRRVNPILSLKNQHRKNYRNRISGNAYLDFKITENLSFKSIAQATQFTSVSEVFDNSLTQSASPYYYRRVNGSIYNSESNSFVNENILTWNKSVSGAKFSTVAAATFEKLGSSYYGFASDNIPTEQKGMAGLADGNVYTKTSSIDPGTQRMSYLGRVIFDYRSRYLATVSMRADASSMFVRGKRWGYFPSASVAWNFTEEKFLKGQIILSSGKLRASYGWTGNDRIGSSDRYQQMTTPFAQSYPMGNEWHASSFISYPGNPNLKWERTEQTNFGMDLGFLKNKINLKVDVYRKNTHDLLLNRTLPLATGFRNLRQNIGQVRNQGLEVSLNTVNTKNKSFEWRTDFNISTNENKIIALADGQRSLLSNVAFDNLFESQAAYVAQVGKPVGAFYGYVWDGVYQMDDFIYSDTGIPMAKPNVPVYTTNRPGDIKYRDVNGDGVISDFDRQVIGRTQPLFLGGINNTFTYKRFDLSVFFRWSYGNHVLNANRLGLENGARVITNQFASYVNRWRPDNQDTNIHRVGSNGTYYYSSRVIEDASFLRLQTISLRYLLPNAWLTKASIRALNISIAANNLFTWTNYSGYDPEVSARHSALTPGFDFSAYPRARTLALTLNVSL